MKKKIDYINLNKFLKNSINIYHNENNNNNINDVHKFYPCFKFDFYINDFKDINSRKNNENKNDLKQDNNIINNVNNDIINESKKKYNILNIKIVKRLIYDIIYLKSIELSEIKNIVEEIENIIYIYEVL